MKSFTRVYGYINHLEQMLKRKLKKPCDVMFRKSSIGNSLMVIVYCDGLRYNKVMNIGMMEMCDYSSTDAEDLFCDEVFKMFEVEREKCH